FTAPALHGASTPRELSSISRAGPRTVCASKRPACASPRSRRARIYRTGGPRSFPAWMTADTAWKRVEPSDLLDLRHDSRRLHEARPRGRGERAARHAPGGARG